MTASASMWVLIFLLVFRRRVALCLLEERRNAAVRLEVHDPLIGAKLKRLMIT